MELAHKREFDRDNVHNLVYHLTLPGPGVSLCIAELIASQPSITTEPSKFPGRLAFGVVDDGLTRFDPSARAHRQAKLFRKINLIGVGLCQRQFPDEVVEVIRRRFSELSFAAESLSQLAIEEREFFPPELAIFVEKIVEAAIHQAALVTLLIERVTERLDGIERRRLLNRTQSTIREGLNNEPWDNNSPLKDIVDLTQPICFRRELKSHEKFNTTIDRVLESIQENCL